MVRELTTDEVEAMLEGAEQEAIADGRIVKSEFGGEFTATQRVRHDADERVLYDRRTGIPTVVKLYEGNRTVEKMLEKTDPATGLRIFTTRSPQDRPDLFTLVASQPNLPCWFSDRHPRANYYRGIVGVTARCPKATLDTPESVRAHVENKHPRWLGMVERHEADTRYQTEREEARATLNAMLALAREQGIEAPKAYPCEYCDESFDTPRGLGIHVGKLHKEVEE